MAQTLTKFAKFFRPIGKGTDEIVAIRIHKQGISLAEVDATQHRIRLENLLTIPLPRAVDVRQIARQTDMIADSLRAARAEGLYVASDAGLIIPSHLVTLRQINLPYMSPAELAREGRAVDFWVELEPDIATLEDPFVVHYELVSAENDDLTRVVIGYCEMADLRPWSELLLSAHLNPTYLDLEPIALANYLYASLPHEERRQSQAILHISAGHAEIIALQPKRFQTVKLDISAFDHVLLAEIEDVDNPDGSFWDEVGGRVGNALKQAVLFLQEEQDFPPFSVIHLVVDAPRASQLSRLLNQHFTLAPISLWNCALGADAAPSVSALFASQTNNSGYAALFGLGMRRLGTFGDSDPGLIELSFLPGAEILRRNRQLGVVSRALFKFSAVISVVMGVWTLGFVLPAYTDSERKSRGIEAVRAEAEASRSRLGDIQNRVARLETDLVNLGKASSPRGKTMIIDMLPDLLPHGAELSSYRVEAGNIVTIAGSATNRDQILGFADDLVSSNLLTNPQTTSNPRSYDDFLNFTLSGTLRQMR